MKNIIIRNNKTVAYEKELMKINLFCVGCEMVM